MSHTSRRRQFLSRLGALGLGTLLPVSKKLNAATDPGSTPLACTLIPTETRGPFPLFDSTAIASQSALVRSNITGGQTGVPFALTVTVQNLDCTPIPNVLVYIWHCSKDGLYSGYSNSMNPGQAGQTYLRGIQATNSAGQANFTTVFPGWYNGRLTHIHVEVYAGSALLRTSQFAFPLDSVAGSSTALVNASYGNSNNTITAYSGDNVFNNGYTEQLLTLSGSVAAGYTAEHTFTVNYSALPLKLVSFTAGLENKNPMLWWVSENEEDLTRFEIEQSTHPSKDYVTVGTVSAANTSGTNNYSFSLRQPLPAEITYFRLKIINADGSFIYSTIANIHLHLFDTLSLVNSYATNHLVIRHPAVYSNSILKIASMSGQVVATGKLTTGAALTSIDTRKLSEGMYLLIIETGIDRYVTKFTKGH